MTTDQIADTIEKAAKAATTGEWKYRTGPSLKSQYHCVHAPCTWPDRDWDDMEVCECSEGNEQDQAANAIYIVAAQPINALALTAERKAMKAEIAAYKRYFEQHGIIFLDADWRDWA